VDFAIVLRLRDNQNLGWSRMAEVYRKKLIDVVGNDGGFILSPRSSTDEVKPENLKSMIEFTKEYGKYLEITVLTGDSNRDDNLINREISWVRYLISGIASLLNAVKTSSPSVSPPTTSQVSKLMTSNIKSASLILPY
jgi:hypothetical protein